MIKFTIATVCFNAAAFLRRTILSVEEQDYAKIEHLIIDGRSKDETLAQIHHYQERNSHLPSPHEIVCLSEPDQGLYDAMNKALRLATGEYILFLNAGDKFHCPSTLSQIAQLLSEGHYDSAHLPAVIYGDTHLVDDEGRFLRRRRLSPPERLNWRSFRHGMLVCHQAFFARTDLARMNTYDLSYRFSADFDWCIRILRTAHGHRLPLLNTHLVIADYLSEGMTTRHHKDSLRERFHIMCKHYGFLPTLLQHAWFVVRALLKK
ncbi:glycosyltransferase [Alloprevotella sp. OH1205_COT-284]|uniref:glycosyltransferase family 2 protein n=1 Tax=Alloprevotella sp. OH1205_COT-284 TaxID=2491043 RepID=UPI000F5ECA1D|nr:glycosyltransferase family 2 protein [Alloprevotella sp. OH1205_COT-284]RRD79992.1 glycosyltransferase [Alloprevotella sp. OH1205_COT-284]